MSKSISIEFEINGKTNTVPYGVDSRGVFLVAKKGRKPSRAKLGELREGMEIYCVMDKITISVNKAERLVKPQYERELKNLDRAIRHIGYLSRSVRGVLGFIRENRLGRAFDREYRVQLKSYRSKRKIPRKRFALRNPYQQARYWGRGPDPLRHVYAPHFPFEFDNLILFSEVSTDLTRGYGVYRKFSKDISEVRRLGNNTAVEKRVNGVRRTLLSLGAASGTVRGTKSRRIRGRMGRSSPRSRPTVKTSIAYFDRMLRLKEKLRKQLGIRRNSAIAKITKIGAAQSSRGVRTSRHGIYHMPRMRFAPLRVKRGSGISDTIIDSLPIKKRSRKHSPQKREVHPEEEAIHAKESVASSASEPEASTLTAAPTPNSPPPTPPNERPLTQEEREEEVPAAPNPRESGVQLKDGRRVQTRPVEMRDKENLVAFYAELSPEVLKWALPPYDRPRVERMFGDPAQPIGIVAEVDGKTVGHLHIFRYLSRMSHVGSLIIYLNQGFLNVGLGSAMMKSGLELARTQGLHRVELSVIDSNENAIHLYEKVGFKREGVKTAAYLAEDGSYHDAIDMGIVLV